VASFLLHYRVPNIPRLWAAYHYQQRFQLVMEYASLGNLLEVLKRQGGGGLAEDKVSAVVGDSFSRHCLPCHECA